MAAHHPTRVDIDWDSTDPTLLGPLLRRLHPFFAEDLLVEANIPYMDWFRAAKKGRGTDLQWLSSRIEHFSLKPEERSELYAGARIAIRWELGHGPMTRSNLSLPGVRKFFYHDGPLLRRADVSLAAELESPTLPIRKLSRARGEQLLDLARETSAMRYRELHGFTYGDPAHVIHTELGRGVEVFVTGIPPEHRLPLRAYHAGMFFKNAVPIGYIECLTLFDRMEVGFNLYYTFREGETAWLYARLLHLFRQLLGVNYFAVDPYRTSQRRSHRFRRILVLPQARISPDRSQSGSPSGIRRKKVEGGSQLPDAAWHATPSGCRLDDLRNAGRQARQVGQFRSAPHGHAPS